MENDSTNPLRLWIVIENEVVVDETPKAKPKRQQTPSRLAHLEKARASRVAS